MDVRDDVVQIIAGFPLFADLSGPELARVVRPFDEALFAEGERILRQGFPGSGFYIILDGSAAIRIDGVDRFSLGPGDYFGEISCLLGVPPTADIIPLRPLRCLVMTAADLEPFLIANPRVMFRVLQAEARRLSSTTKSPS